MEIIDDHKINLMIKQWINGNTTIENELFYELYPTFRKIAQREHRRINISEMNTTLLVNELYLKFKHNNHILVNDKNHLLALSARIIRFLLIDSIKTNLPLKNGGAHQRITLNETPDKLCSDGINIDFLNLHRLLFDLEKIDSNATKIIELRFFAGLSIEETAEVMNVSNSNISRNWHFAKSWLMNKLNAPPR